MADTALVGAVDPAMLTDTLGRWLRLGRWKRLGACKATGLVHRAAAYATWRPQTS